MLMQSVNIRFSEWVDGGGGGGESWIMCNRYRRQYTWLYRIEITYFVILFIFYVYAIDPESWKDIEFFMRSLQLLNLLIYKK